MRKAAKKRVTMEGWNSTHPVGTRVRYWPIIKMDGTKPLPAEMTTTRSEAFEASDGMAVIFVHARRGSVALSHVEAA